MPYPSLQVTDSTGVKRTGPTVTVGAGLGTAPPAIVLNSDYNDDRGSLTFGSGSAPGAGAILAFVFAVPKDTSRLPVVSITETTVATALLSPAVTSISSTGFTVSSLIPTASQANTVYGIQWTVQD
jgi:hypothetical protein